MTFKNQLRSLNSEEMSNLALSLGEKSFRGTQLFSWVSKGATTFEEMGNLPQGFRRSLEELYTLDCIALELEQISKLDGTRKFLFRLEDGNYIESVFLKYEYGNSICISSQAGCRMGCKFCASTINGLIRNLTCGEIISQIIEAERITGETINHIVVMGTGEPFDNYDNLVKAIRILTDKKGRNMSMRNITVSTCGIASNILNFGRDLPQANLAISLHASNNSLRSSMMPINNRYSIEEVIDACSHYYEMTHRRITFEYTLVEGVNDGEEDIRGLKKLLSKLNCHINVIALNEVEETKLSTVTKKKARNFVERLKSEGLNATLRRSLGKDIDGACGQLRLVKAKESGKKEEK